MEVSRKRRKLSNGEYESKGAVSKTATEDVPAVEKKAQRRSLFVRSLPASVTTERLTEHFSQSYPLKHATVVLDPKTKISKGFGFVTFTDAEDAQAAAAEFNNSKLDGRIIKVEVAESRHREVVEGQGKSGPNLKAVALRAEREKQRTETQPPRLIVRNLPWSIKEPEDLAILFRSYGKVKHAVVPKRSPKVQAGFGFVVLRGKRNAEKAIEGVNGKEVEGRTLAVDWAVDKKTWEDLQFVQADEEELPRNPLEEGTGKQANIADIATNGQNESVFAAPEPEFDSEPDTENEDVGSYANGIEELDTDESLHDGNESANDDISKDEENGEDRSNNTTVFVRNLPFTTDDDSLKDHFGSFGAVRYARVVYDPETERSKGTGFVCFFNESDAKSCVVDAPKQETPTTTSGLDRKGRGQTMMHSVLENEASDPSGRYSLEGRVLQVSRALNKVDASRRADEASSKRDVRDRDKRRLYLLSEGTISKSSRLYDQVGKAELDVRESSAKQRQKLIQNNPNLGLSLTRLSIRNIPRSIGSKELKALAREAVVGFATDVKNGVRQPLSRDEITRGGDAMREAEKRRKEKGVGIVRQAKIVFEGREGAKVNEKTGGGRSRGYGFIEYVRHREALMGLRWLNGHVVKGADGEKGKRVIVEFAIENAQVVQRRAGREERIRTNPREANGVGEKARGPEKKGRYGLTSAQGQKRKRDEKPENKTPAAKEAPMPEEKNKLAKRNRIIAQKRQRRKTRKAGGN